MTPTELVLQCLKESGSLTLEALVYESSLDETTVAASLLRLEHEGRVNCSKGVFTLSTLHSQRIKRGLLLKGIPSICNR